MLSRSRFPINPSGVIPASNSTRRPRPPRRTSTIAEKPCSARRKSTVLPPSASSVGTTGIGPAVPTGPHRRTRPSSGMSTSEELSTTVVTQTCVDWLQRDRLHIPTVAGAANRDKRRLSDSSPGNRPDFAGWRCRRGSASALRQRPPEPTRPRVSTTARAGAQRVDSGSGGSPQWSGVGRPAQPGRGRRPRLAARQWGGRRHAPTGRMRTFVLGCRPCPGCASGEAEEQLLHDGLLFAGDPVGVGEALAQP